MDINSIGSLSTAMSDTEASAQIQTAVLKKALDVQEQSAMALVEMAAQSRPANPPHLGNAVDTFA